MKSLWNKKEAAKAKDKLELLVYRSRLIGSEPKLCVWGGGNTSTKVTRKDHCGRERRVLHIKGSGSDLKSSTVKDYPPVALDDLLQVFKREQMSDEEMVDYVSRCLLEPKAPRPSIEVLLHAFVDQTDIDHTHADAILSITNTKNGKKIAQKIYGDELLWVPYVKPGFTLAKWAGEAYRKNPKAKGVILEKHGLITWGPDARTSYRLTIEMVTRAEKYLEAARKKKKVWSPSIFIRRGEVTSPSSAGRALPAGRQGNPAPTPTEQHSWLLQFLPLIRKKLSTNQKVVLHVTQSSEVMEFVNARDAARVSQLGPATPDHMLRTKRVPLYVHTTVGARSPRPPKGRETLPLQHQIISQMDAYAERHRQYFEKYKHLLPASARTMLNPYPKVILIPGIGMITSGSDLKSAKIVAEIYEHSISVMKNASTIDTYESLSERLAFEMDYWPMELYKLFLALPEAELARQVGLVTGAARGIGRAIALELVQKGAHVFLADIQEAVLSETVSWIHSQTKSNRAFALPLDVTNHESVKRGIEKIVLECGGLDFLVSNAGIAHVSPIDELRLEDWEKSFAVNATGHFLVAREVIRVLKRQQMGGGLVFIATKNVLAPGKDFGAYSASKAAEAQLARILAIENGEHGIRVNMVNPDGVFEDSGLWETVGPSRAQSYGISSKELPKYYQNRNLMKTPVFPQDVAEAVSFLISSKSSKTTGCILTVDGGVKEAFPR